jgi:hypothetical protein
MSVQVLWPPETKDNADILGDTIETLELTIRSARRCAYDLRHCVDCLGMDAVSHLTGDDTRKMFRDRADYFVKLFQSGNAMKDYRHQLYHEIDELERRVETLRRILKEHKIDDPTLF